MRDFLFTYKRITILKGNLLSVVNQVSPSMKKMVPIIAFIVPFVILYVLYPDSYDLMWKGRAFYFFFMWLLFMEILINWDRITGSRLTEIKSSRTVVFIVAVALPILYVIAANYLGLNSALMEVARSYDVVPDFVQFVPLFVEYLVFTGLFTFILSMYYGIRQISNFAVSMIFLGVIGALYMIDTLYPWGRFTPFQILVPTTTQLSASVLNMMGYKTSIAMVLIPSQGVLPVLTVRDLYGHISVHPVAWVCSGIESLIIFSAIIPLFFKNSGIPWKQRVVYFIFGAAVTYFINALRIATIFIIDLNGGDWNTFHNLYGMVYSMSWIISYPLLIMGSRALWGRLTNREDKLDLSNSLPKLELPSQ
jgi:thaumarchaeosortase